MRTAELTMAAALMALSAYFMWHATALPIGWARESGPGGGAFPFWLSVILGGAAAAIFVRELRAVLAGRTRAAPFLRPGALRPILVTAGALIVTVALIGWIGTYGALVLFLLFQLRVVGRHRWVVVVPLTLGVPVAVFLFFEATLRILLPKGLMEPWFFPLYALFF